MLTKPHKYIHPLADRVLIRRDEAESISKGGILIAATAQEKPRRGTVLAVGPGHTEGPTAPRTVR